MIRELGILAIAAFCAGPVMAGETRSDVVRRIDQSARVLNGIMASPGNGIPHEILANAICVAVIPGMKRAGLVIGAKYGKGVLLCRTANGWSGPAMVRLEGGSFGAQIGAGEADVVLVATNRDGAGRLMKSEFTIGADAAAMAGPAGRSVSERTDAYMTAGILTCSRSRGLFAGVVLDGATLRSDDAGNALLYGHNVPHEAILKGRLAPPKAARPLYAALHPYIPLTGEAARTNTRPGSGILTAAGRMPVEHDSLTLADGRQIRGKLLSTTATHVRFRSDDGRTRIYPRSEVTRIDFDL